MTTELTDLIGRERRRHRNTQIALCIGVLLVVISTRSDRAMFQFGTPEAFAVFGDNGDMLNSAFYAAPGIPGFALLGAGGPFGGFLPGSGIGAPPAANAVSFSPAVPPASNILPGGTNNAVPGGAIPGTTPGTGFPTSPGTTPPGIIPPGSPASPPDIVEPYIPTVPSAVPEPATWAMMILGFLGIGSALRRHKRKAARHQAETAASAAR